MFKSKHENNQTLRTHMVAYINIRRWILFDKLANRRIR